MLKLAIQTYGRCYVCCLGLVRLFEKHFTYDKTASGFDHAHAQDYADYVNMLRF